MAELRKLTEISSVNMAVDQYRALGRAAFLEHLGFHESRDYFLHYDDELFDSKPIVAAAYGFQFPAEGPLHPDEFSGGASNAVRALERLGLSVVTRAQLHPPILGTSYPDRTAIQAAYGGDKMAGVIRFPGEDIINVFSDARSPYADEAPSLTEPFGYRGQGLSGPQKVTSGANALLERARLSGEPVRFWHRPVGEPFMFLSWAVVVGRAWVEGTGQDNAPRPELDWRIETVPGPSHDDWPESVFEAIREAAASTEDHADVPEARPQATYRQLLARVDERGQPRRPTGQVRIDYARSTAARRAVLERAGGTCENPRCTGMPGEPNRKGEPILDVDHINDLALGGDDHPLNMVALCPNCHAVKTRGARVSKQRRQLIAVVKSAHEAHLAGHS